MKIRRKALAIVLVVGCAGNVTACETLGLSRLTASLRADATEIRVARSGFEYAAEIPFTYVNTTSGPVSMVGCGGPTFPELEKKIEGHWVPAYYAAYMACRTIPDFTIPSGKSFHSVLKVNVSERGHNVAPELLVDSIPGTYRLRWNFVAGTDPTARRAKRVDATSNEFHMLLNP